MVGGGLRACVVVTRRTVPATHARYAVWHESAAAVSSANDVERLPPVACALPCQRIRGTRCSHAARHDEGFAHQPPIDAATLRTMSKATQNALQ